MPVGKYRLTHALGAGVSPFTMRLPEEFGGYRVRCDLRDSVAREVCFTGCYEPQETRIAQSVLLAGTTAVDVGANWGYFSLLFAELVGPSGRVLSFEPEPRLFDALRDGMAANDLEQVTPYPLAVAAGPARLRFKAYREDGGNFGVTRRAASAEPPDFDCDAVALDDFLDALSIPDVQLVKIDVEGGELDVLAGMQRGLAYGRYRYVLLECHPDEGAGLTVDACAAPLRAAGYRLWTIDHSPSMHRRAAVRRMPPCDLLRPYRAGRTEPAVWPHLLAAAPGVPLL
jgi:FkbM family methyltransferase